MSEVQVTRSITGKWWRLRYNGKVEFTEEEPTEAHKAAFRKSAEAARGQPSFSGNGRSFTVSEVETRRTIEELK